MDDNILVQLFVILVCVRACIGLERDGLIFQRGLFLPTQACKGK